MDLNIYLTQLTISIYIIVYKGLQGKYLSIYTYLIYIIFDDGGWVKYVGCPTYIIRSVHLTCVTIYVKVRITYKTLLCVGTRTCNVLQCGILKK